jgi:hypothetical protein
MSFYLENRITSTLPLPHRGKGEMCALDNVSRKRIFESLMAVDEIASAPPCTPCGAGLRLAMTKEGSDG